MVTHGTKIKQGEPAFLTPRWVSQYVIWGARLAWSAGGTWERLFVVVPGIFAAYLSGALLWIVLSSQPSLVFMNFMWVALSFIALYDVWLTPILSGRVLKAIASTGQAGKDEGFLRMLAEYLEAHHTGGRWLRANVVSLAYLLIFLGWGLFAMTFSNVTGIESTWIFLAIHAVLLATLYVLYQRMLVHFALDAAQKGFPFHPKIGRVSGARSDVSGRSDAADPTRTDRDR